MTRVYIVRHGQTEWNRQERFRGHIDIPLNEVGLAQSRAIAADLEKVALAAVYTSPLGRAVETARPTAQSHGLELQPLAGILDINYGQWAGHSTAEVRSAYPDLLRLWHAEPERVDIPGGESLKAVRSRAMAAVHEVLARHAGDAILLVSHQMVGKVLVCTMLGLEVNRIWRIQQDNACINIFDWDGADFSALLVNGTAHLCQA